MAVLASWRFILSIAVAEIPPDLTGDLQVTPPSVTLTHPERPHSILVRAHTQGGYDIDLTADTKFTSTNPQIAKVDATGWIQPIANGETTITAKAGDRTATVTVTVKLPEKPVDVSFRKPIFLPGTVTFATHDSDFTVRSERAVHLEGTIS